MSNVVEGLFLFALWTPPLVVLAGALSLFVKTPAPRQSSEPAPVARLAH